MALRVNGKDMKDAVIKADQFEMKILDLIPDRMRVSVTGIRGEAFNFVPRFLTMVYPDRTIEAKDTGIIAVGVGKTIEPTIEFREKLRIETFLIMELRYALNTVLVYWIILAAIPEHKDRRFAAEAGAAVFGVHTLFTSAVSYIAGRSSVLCATFYFLAVLLFLKAVDTPRRSARALYLVLVGLAGWVAWQTKQEAITLPLVLAGVLFLRIERKDWRWILPLVAIPPAIVVLMRDQIAALYAMVSENRVLVSAGFEKVLPPATYFRTYLTSVVEYYFPRFLLPVGLSADPRIEPIEHWYSPEFLVSILMFGALAWMALHYSKREPLFSLGLTAL